MNLLITFTYNITLERYYKFGIIYREISIYKEFSKSNVNIGFLTYGNYKEREYSKLIDPIKIFPIYKYIKSNINIIRQIKSLFLPFKLKKLFSSTDIIKTVQIYGSWVGIIAKILYRKKLIIRAGFEWLNIWSMVAKKNSLKNYIYYLLRYSFIFINELISYKIANGIILTNEYDIPYIIKIFKLKRKYKNNKICHISNCIDTDIFKPIPMPKKNKHILWIGRFRHGKNLFNILESFKDLKDFQLDIIGKGHYEQEQRIKKKIKELGVNINFLGTFPNPKIPEILNQYDIFILPSEAEGNPKVLLEAMSCGIACIGSDIKGINNIIKHRENGYLCGLTPDSIRDAILTLYNDEGLRKVMGKNARQYVINNCAVKSVTQKEYLFYKELLKN